MEEQQEFVDTRLRVIGNERAGRRVFVGVESHGNREADVTRAATDWSVTGIESGTKVEIEPNAAWAARCLDQLDDGLGCTGEVECGRPQGEVATEGHSLVVQRSTEEAVDTLLGQVKGYWVGATVGHGRQQGGGFLLGMSVVLQLQ